MRLRNRKGEIKKSWITLAVFIGFSVAIAWHYLFIIPAAGCLFLFILQRIDEIDLLE